jgi:hypothetical protein
MNTEQEISVPATETPAQEPKTEAKPWPASASQWEPGKKVVIQDLHGKGIKSALVLNYYPNFLVALKVGNALNKFQQGVPVKVGENVFYVAQRNVKLKAVGLYYVCNYAEAKARSEEAEKTASGEKITS